MVHDSRLRALREPRQHCKTISWKLKGHRHLLIFQENDFFLVLLVELHSLFSKLLCYPQCRHFKPNSFCAASPLSKIKTQFHVPHCLPMVLQHTLQNATGYARQWATRKGLLALSSALVAKLPLRLGCWPLPHRQGLTLLMDYWL